MKSLCAQVGPWITSTIKGKDAFVGAISGTMGITAADIQALAEAK